MEASQLSSNGGGNEPPLSDLQRRFIANLPQPRNLYMLSQELRQDPYTVVPDGSSFIAHPGDMDALLQTALANGWVVNLGEFDDPAKLAAAAQNNPDVIDDWTDDQANLLATRLAIPERAWRMQGDQYMLSNAGLEKLKEPVGTSAPATPTQVQALVDAEWTRTIKDVTIEQAQGNPDYDEPLHNALLQDEFLTWFNLVADECERIWNVRPTAPLAGGAGWTDVYENRILDHENQKTALPALVAPWFMALTIVAFTDTDTPTTSQDGTHKPTYTGYADKSVAATDMATASAGSSANSNAIQFAACTGGTSAILGFANKETNGTTGDLRKYGTCTSTTVSTTQTPAQFAAGAYTTTAD